MSFPFYLFQPESHVCQVMVRVKQVPPIRQYVITTKEAIFRYYPWFLCQNSPETEFVALSNAKGFKQWEIASPCSQ
jgi:hypothetical protein